MVQLKKNAACIPECELERKVHASYARSDKHVLLTSWAAWIECWEQISLWSFHFGGSWSSLLETRALRGSARIIQAFRYFHSKICDRLKSANRLASLCWTSRTHATILIRIESEAVGFVISGYGSFVREPCGKREGRDIVQQRCVKDDPGGRRIYLPGR